MTSLSLLRQRFLKDAAPIRMGGIAADLARLSGLAKAKCVTTPAFLSILTEVKLFTEWAGQDSDIDRQQTILALQRTLAKWQGDKLQQLKPDDVSGEAKKWSDSILSESGLLD